MCPVLRPTCSRVFKESGTGEEPGTIAAFNAMRKRQAENVAAPTMEEHFNLEQQGTADEEVEPGIMLYPSFNFYVQNGS